MSERGRGRGAYFRNKYGGGRGGRGGGQQQGNFKPSEPAGNAGGGTDWQRLQNDLRRVDGAQYGAYKDLKGQYRHSGPNFTLSVDHVQGDFYAPPSRVRAIMPWSETDFPDECLESDTRRIALCDFVTRVAADMIRAKHFDQNIGSSNGGWSGPKGGSFNINSPGQEVLPRTSAMINGDKSIELRFTVSLPAAGRTILGQQAWQILGVNLAELVRQSLLHANLDQEQLRMHIMSVERQRALRDQLQDLGLIAFVANGAILPRESGATSGPMEKSKAVPFKSPPEAEVSLTIPDGSQIVGMGVSRGITLLTGGGYHGKSTLLEALETGIYDHIPGDGREMVVTDPTAVKIRAEDGRGISGVNISPFIANLPGGKDTKRFSTEDASGSTSMAANIQEALELGCKTLLIDEDSSATNLLVRDQRMQLLIRKEPITPLISKARALYTEHGVSTIIVIGGLGDWLSVSDTVIAMDSYVPHIITPEAKAVIQKYPTNIQQDATYGSLPERKFALNLSGYKSPMARRRNFISMTPHDQNPVHDPSEAEPGVDLSGLDQLVEVGQARAIASLLQRIASMANNKSLPLSALLHALDEAVGIEKCLPVSLDGGEIVAVRRFELVAALSRMKQLHVGD